MSYYVYWTPSAHDRLERLWMAAEDQAILLRAANAIDKYLAEDPYRIDAALVGGESTFIVEPLAVDYVIFEDERRVVILSVWFIGFLDQAN